MGEVNFFTEDIIFELETPHEVQEWIEKVIEQEGFSLTCLNFIFCSDTYLHEINVEYLDHDTYTDIITFDNSDSTDELEGDIFISVDRIRENAETLEKTFDEELHRVIIHGVLHLLGYKDKSKEDAQMMRQKEDEALKLRQE